MEKIISFSKCGDCHLNCFRLRVPKPDALRISFHLADDSDHTVLAFAAPYYSCQRVFLSSIIERLQEILVKHGDVDVVSISFDNFPF